MKLKLFSSCILAAAAASTAFGGLIGNNYFDADISYVRLSGLDTSVDGWGGGFSGNYVLVQDKGIGLDFQPFLGYSRLSGGDITKRSQNVGFGFTTYLENDTVKPFIEASTSWVWSRAELNGDSEDESFWVFDVGVGAEVAISEALSMKYSVKYSRAEELSDDGFGFGVSVHNWFTDTLGARLGYTIWEGAVKEHEVFVCGTMRF